MPHFKNQVSSLLNQIPTKLRGKYISLLKRGSVDSNLIKELDDLARQTSQKALPNITYPDLPVADKVDDIKAY